MTEIEDALSDGWTLLHIYEYTSRFGTLPQKHVAADLVKQTSLFFRLLVRIIATNSFEFR
jgi:hypothetical protein